MLLSIALTGAAVVRITSLLTTVIGIAITTTPAPVGAAQLRDAEGRVRVALIKMPYSGSRNVQEISDVPEYLWAGGIADTLLAMGSVLRPVVDIRLLPDEEDDYGTWHRMGMANGHVAEQVARNFNEGFLSVGLLANCTSLLGFVGGLQNARPEEGRQRVGLVFIDAHGDFNTPETTLSGMLGGMPVAVVAGMALQNLRLESGLEEPIPTSQILMGAVRDLDPLERELVNDSDLELFSVEDIRTKSARLRALMDRLSSETDVIYVHIDMDVLDPKEVPGHPLTVPNGPTSRELADAIELMLQYEKVAAFGVASTPANERDPEGLSLTAAYNLIKGAVSGVQRR